MKGDWPLAAADVRPGVTPRAQTCPACGLVYHRVRFERVEPDPCPMCRLVALRREEAAREASCR